MIKRKVFVSFDWEKDKHYKFLLNAWDENPEFEFAFWDYSSKEIKSDNISVVKAALTKKIHTATHTLVLIGEDANKIHPDALDIGYTNWQNFEIAKSKGVTKLIGVKLNNSNASPKEILNSGASWARSFNQDNILKALREAK